MLKPTDSSTFTNRLQLFTVTIRIPDMKTGNIRKPDVFDIRFSNCRNISLDRFIKKNFINKTVQVSLRNFRVFGSPLYIVFYKCVTNIFFSEIRVQNFMCPLDYRDFRHKLKSGHTVQRSYRYLMLNSSLFVKLSLIDFGCPLFWMQVSTFLHVYYCVIKRQQRGSELSAFRMDSLSFEQETKHKSI